VALVWLYRCKVKVDPESIHVEQAEQSIGTTFILVDLISTSQFKSKSFKTCIPHNGELDMAVSLLFWP